MNFITELDIIPLLIIISGALSIGFNKTSGIAITIIFIPLMAGIMPARQSVGFILPMLCLADLTAIIYWHHSINWHSLLRLLPWTLPGIAMGYFLLGKISDPLLMILIGSIIILLMAFTLWRNSSSSQDSIPTSRYFAALMGILAGATTTLANAAGPVMVIYLLAMKLPKNQFIATSAWFFWLINLIKVPFLINLGLITTKSFLANLTLYPAILLGGLLGIVLVKKIPQKQFNLIVSLLALVAACYLCYKGLRPFIPD